MDTLKKLLKDLHLNNVYDTCTLYSTVLTTVVFLNNTSLLITNDFMLLVEFNLFVLSMDKIGFEVFMGDPVIMLYYYFISYNPFLS